MFTVSFSLLLAMKDSTRVTRRLLRSGESEYAIHGV